MHLGNIRGKAGHCRSKTSCTKHNNVGAERDFILSVEGCRIVVKILVEAIRAFVAQNTSPSAHKAV
jgi:hypothetical protein